MPAVVVLFSWILFRVAAKFWVAAWEGFAISMCFRPMRGRYSLDPALAFSAAPRSEGS